MRSVVCVLVAVALTTLAVAPAASANRSQFTIFQATREVRSPDPAVRADALGEIEALGSTGSAWSCTGRTSRLLPMRHP